MIEMRMKCERCGRSAVLHAGAAPTWGKLQLPSGDEWDICPGCVAELSGWKGAHGWQRLERHANA